MGKIQVTLNAQALRNLVSKRTYKNKEGQDVEVQEVKFELVEVKEPKQIYEKDNMKIMKTHFASVIQTKEEREAKTETIYIGDGFTTIWSNAETVTHVATPIVEVQEHDDLPF
jgi:hypothetical protein